MYNAPLERTKREQSVENRVTAQCAAQACNEMSVFDRTTGTSVRNGDRLNSMPHGNFDNATRNHANIK